MALVVGLPLLYIALFETTDSASALDSASLAPRLFMTFYHACYAYELRASDERTESKAEYKAEAVVSKTAYMVARRLKRHIISQRCPQSMTPLRIPIFHNTH